MSEVESLFGVLRQSADAESVAAIEDLVQHGVDHELCRVNVPAFAAKRGLNPERAIGAFLHAARIGIFKLSWNVLCPGCGGVLNAGSTLKSLNQEQYNCALCAAGYEPTLDDMVEVTVTVSPRVRHIDAHDPKRLSLPEYMRQRFWGSGVDLADDFKSEMEDIRLEDVELQPGEKGVLSVQLPLEFVILFDPVTHSTQFLNVKGESTPRAAEFDDAVQQVARAERHVDFASRAVARFAREPHGSPRPAGTVDRRRQAPPYAGPSPSVPHGKAAAYQPGVPRHLSHRDARCESAAQDHQPHLPVYRS